MSNITLKKCFIVHLLLVKLVWKVHQVIIGHGLINKLLLAQIAMVE